MANCDGDDGDGLRDLRAAAERWTSYGDGLMSPAWLERLQLRLAVAIAWVFGDRDAG
ncbi:MAG: hypothetical protein L0Y42_14660 [Phycisphaerales bacterium]|nr:hypothetical protein [Phycisphaerales bacterium]